MLLGSNELDMIRNSTPSDTANIIRMGYAGLGLLILPVIFYSGGKDI